MTLQEFAKESNMDLITTISRFGGNEEMLVRFLKKFIHDKTYEELQIAVDRRDYPLIERSAHTLKGVAANLGLEDIRVGSDSIVTAVRKETYDTIPGFFQELQKYYGRTIECLNLLD